MSQVKISGNASGTGIFTIASPNGNTDRTLTLPDATTTVVGTDATQTLTNKTLSTGLVMGVSTITSGTAVASTSGTSIDFTSIPSWAKRITVAMQTVSTNGSSNYLLRIGNSSVTTSGYASVMNYVNPGANSCTGTSDATGFILSKDVNSSTSLTATCTLVLLSSGFYVFSFVGNNGVNGAGYFGSGLLNLGSTLDRVRITTINGTDTFDTGSINILYE
jgi:hypothetical protein